MEIRAGCFYVVPLHRIRAEPLVKSIVKILPNGIFLLLVGANGCSVSRDVPGAGGTRLPRGCVDADPVWVHTLLYKFVYFVSSAYFAQMCVFVHFCSRQCSPHQTSDGE